jgi:hypothetical protein
MTSVAFFFALVCKHCGTPATADGPVQTCFVDGEEILLHRDVRPTG